MLPCKKLGYKHQNSGYVQAPQKLEEEVEEAQPRSAQMYILHFFQIGQDDYIPIKYNVLA
jgi:hypothetical protein